MDHTRKTAQTHEILGAGPGFVKGQIYSAGLTMGKLARAAGIAPSTLSDYVAGRRSRRETSRAIWRAYVRLSGLETSFEAFWFAPRAKRSA